jgi:hypothetical protein
MKYVRVEVFTVVRIYILFFGVVILCSLVDDYQCLHPEDGGIKFLQNNGSHLQFPKPDDHSLSLWKMVKI